MNKKCSNCRLVNYPNAIKCVRCQADLTTISDNTGGHRSRGMKILVRAVVCFCVCLAMLFGFYLSLIGSAKSLTLEEKGAVRNAIKVLKDKGFSHEAMLLESFTVYRSNDNWLNASVEKESAFAATNFPFEIMTLYPDFFMYPADDIERAAILLHEAQHLQGSDEKEAYEFVWKNRNKLGWTKEKYINLYVWKNVRKQTREYSPDLFVCERNEFNDCTEL
jgi:hypothetical protein